MQAEEPDRMNQIINLTPKDFETDQEVRWCPGCGDYAILKSMRKVLAELGRNPDEVVVVSGIGCAARLPYYLETYGFHSIHGRAPSLATGIKLANPELDVWVVGGDGDFLAIGGNHLMHILRRNVDVNLVLFNNAVYGLTKGQSSPTSAPGTRSPSTPDGSVDPAVNPAMLALGGSGGFVARTADTLQDHLPEVLLRAHGFQWRRLRRSAAELHRLQRQRLRRSDQQEKSGGKHRPRAAWRADAVRRGQRQGTGVRTGPGRISHHREPCRGQRARRDELGARRCACAPR